jgi:glutamyl endopeptidase
MLTDWQKMDGIWYYLGGSGTMATDWRYIDGTRYYFYGLFATYGG